MGSQKYSYPNIITSHFFPQSQMKYKQRRRGEYSLDLVLEFSNFQHGGDVSKMPSFTSQVAHYPYFFWIGWQGSHLIQVNQNMVVADFCSAHVVRCFKLKKIKTSQMLINRRKPWGTREKKSVYYQIKPEGKISSNAFCKQRQ